jgi:predicted TIM-barrel fold metal-dependent hydrolase
MQTWLAAPVAVFLSAFTPALAAVTPMIDTHFHAEVGDNVNRVVEGAIQTMDKYGIRRVVIMSQPRPYGVRNPYDIDDLRAAVQRYPGRFLIAAGGGILNPIIQGTNPEGISEDDLKSFRERAGKLAEGASAIGEIASTHLSVVNMGAQHAFQASPPDHPYIRVLADVAAEKGIPLDLHLDLVPQDMDLPKRNILNPSNPPQIKGNKEGLERLLAHNRAAKIVWAHAGNDPLGFRNPLVMRELLARHPNLYMNIRLPRGGPQPFFALNEAGQLKPFWLKLLADYPDRFMLGSDFMQQASGSSRGITEDVFNNFRGLLEQLPEELAQAIAWKNAERLYPEPGLKRP